METKQKVLAYIIRIIDDKKVMIHLNLEISQGDVLVDCENPDKQYDVITVKRIDGLNNFHHLSVGVKLKRVGHIDEPKLYPSKPTGFEAIANRFDTD